LRRRPNRTSKNPQNWKEAIKGAYQQRKGNGASNVHSSAQIFAYSKARAIAEQSNTGISANKLKRNCLVMPAIVATKSPIPSAGKNTQKLEAKLAALDTNG